MYTEIGDQNTLFRHKQNTKYSGLYTENQNMLDLFFFEQVGIFPSKEREVHKMSIYSINSRGRCRGLETRRRAKHNLRIFCGPAPSTLPLGTLDKTGRSSNGLACLPQPPFFFFF